MVLLKDYFGKVNFEKSQQITAKAWKNTQYAESKKNASPSHFQVSAINIYSKTTQK